MHTSPVAAAFDAIRLGPAVVVQNLTMIPLLAAHQSASTPSTGTVSTQRPGSTCSTDSAAACHSAVSYSLLDDALSSGGAEITEVSEQGSVPELKFLNRGANPILIVDGEELLGAKQNRIVNLSILVAASSDLTIPVSCVEAGRWRARSRSFSSAPRTQYATGRAKRMSDVSMSMLSTGARRSNQADVWQDIAEKSARLESPSPTSAMQAIFERHGASIDEYVAGCAPIEGQVGALFLVGDRVIGFDVFDRPSTLAKMLPKLVRGVAVDAIDAALSPLPPSRGCRLPWPEPGRGRAEDEASAVKRAARGTGQAGDPTAARASAFLSFSASASHHVTPAIGLGEDVRLTATGIAGAALVHEVRVVHLGVFAL
jgi:hypothetical protein